MAHHTRKHLAIFAPRRAESIDGIEPLAPHPKPRAKRRHLANASYGTGDESSNIGGSTVPLSTSERASIAARARAEKLSPERRKEIAQQGYLASAVKAVIDRAPDLTPEQFQKLRTIFSSVTPGGDRS